MRGGEGWDELRWRGGHWRGAVADRTENVKFLFVYPPSPFSIHSHSPRDLVYTLEAADPDAQPQRLCQTDKRWEGVAWADGELAIVYEVKGGGGGCALAW